MSSNDTEQSESVWSRVGSWLTGIDKRWFELTFYTSILVWLFYLFIISVGWSWRNKLMAYIVGIPTVLLVLIKVFELIAPDLYDSITVQESPSEADGERNDLKEKYEQATGGPVHSPEERVYYAIEMTIWIVALPVLMFLIGLVNALVLFVFAFGLRFYDDIRDTIVVTVAFSVGMYLFFGLIMGIQFPEGMLPVPSLLEVFGL